MEEQTYFSSFLAPSIPVRSFMTCETCKDFCHTTTYSRLQFLQCSNAMIGGKIAPYSWLVCLLMPVETVFGPLWLLILKSPIAHICLSTPTGPEPF